MEDNAAPLHCVEFSVLPNATGSASWCYKGCMAWAGIQGPQECKMSCIRPDKAYLKVELSPEIGLCSVQESVLIELLKSTCEECIRLEDYPRTEILIRVQILSGEISSACLLSVVLNAVFLALLDGNFKLRCTPAAFSIVDDRYVVVLDSHHNTIISVIPAAFQSATNTSNHLSLNFCDFIEAVEECDLLEIVSIYKNMMLTKFGVVT